MVVFGFLPQNVWEVLGTYEWYFVILGIQVEWWDSQIFSSSQLTLKLVTSFLRASFSCLRDVWKYSHKNTFSFALWRCLSKFLPNLLQHLCSCLTIIWETNRRLVNKATFSNLKRSRINLRHILSWTGLCVQTRNVIVTISSAGSLNNYQRLLAGCGESNYIRLLPFLTPINTTLMLS